MRRNTTAVLALALISACGGDDGTTPDSSVDTGTTDTGMGMDATPDTGVDAGDSGGGDSAPTDTGTADTTVTPDADAGMASLTFSLETDGGFAGVGTNDYMLSGQELTVHRPFAVTMDCTATLTASQMTRLVDGARAVDWAMVMSEYINPSNPMCCCDQFHYALSVRLDEPDGSFEEAMTRWCDETAGSIPADLMTFLSTLEAVGTEACP